ncbi:hypothetical protein KY334_05770, partial [Candidatus Woesearchaeota archaeon]|nr:hypothetical protein [Candidatus Woesearchaeota archaeon]
MSVQNLELKHIDVYLSNFARRYKTENDIADWVAPSFKVMRPSDKYLIYGKENFRVLDNKVTRRVAAKEIDVKADESTYSCEEYITASFVYDRDLLNIEKPIRLKEEKTKQMKDSQMRSREYRVMAIASSPSVVTQTAAATGNWAVVASGTPVSDMVTGMTTIE